jgi:hypothetical protein
MAVLKNANLGLVQTMLHEGGHAADITGNMYNRFKETTGGNIKDFFAVAQYSQQDYANYLKNSYTSATRPKETIADAINVYVQDPEFAKSVSPKVYEFFKNDNSPIMSRINEYIKLPPKERSLQFLIAKAQDDKALRDQALDRIKNRKNRLNFKKIAAEIVGRHSQINRVVSKSNASKEEKSAIERALLNHVRIGELSNNVLSNEMNFAAKGLGFIGEKRNIEWETLNNLYTEVSFLNRIASEQGTKDVINPGFMTKEDALDGLNYYRQIFGNETIDDLTKFQRAFNLMRHKIYQEFGESVSDNDLEMLKNNDMYVKYTPLKYFEKQGGGRGAKSIIYERVGSSTTVAPPLLATIEYDSRAMARAMTNNAKIKVGEFLQNYRPDLIVKDGSDIPFETIEYRKNGEDFKVPVPPELAEGFAYYKPYEFEKLINGLNTFYYLNLIRYNPGYLLWGFPRDVMRTAMAQGTGDRSLIGGTAKTLVDYWRVGTDNKLRQNLMREMGGMLFADSKITSRDLALFMERNPDKEAANFIVKGLDEMVNFFTKLENTSRVVGYLRNKEYNEKLKEKLNNPNLSENKYKSIEDKIRTADQVVVDTYKYTSTPLGAEGGTMRNLTNLFLFFRTIIVGQVRDYDSRYFHNRDGAGGVALQMFNAAQASILLGMASKNAFGLFGEEWQEMYDDIPEHARDYFFTWPIYRTKTGQVVYCVLPVEDSMRPVQNLIYDLANNVFKFSTKKDYASIAGNVASSFARNADLALPNPTPYLSVAGRTADFLLNQRNPINSFTGQHVIPSDTFNYGEYHEKLGYIAKDFLENTLLISFRTPNWEKSDLSGDDFGSFVQDMMHNPVGRNTVSKFLRITPPKDPVKEVNKQIREIELPIKKQEYQIKKQMEKEIKKQNRLKEKFRREAS